MKNLSRAQEVDHLATLLKKALEDRDAISWTDHHPDYPPSVMAFMVTLARSSWMTGDYQKVSFQTVVNSVSNASQWEIMCALTHAARAEKWCTGEWISHLKTDALPSLLGRAQYWVNFEGREC